MKVTLGSPWLERLLDGAEQGVFTERLPEVGHARSRARVAGLSSAVMKIVGIGSPAAARRS